MKFKFLYNHETTNGIKIKISQIMAQPYTAYSYNYGECIACTEVANNFNQV